MKLLCYLTLLLFVGNTPAQERKNRYKLSTSVTVGDETFSAVTAIVGKAAFELESRIGSRVLVRYDLETKEWTDFENRTRISLKQAREWAEASKKKSQDSQASVTDNGLNELMTAMFEPNFVERQEGETLVLENGPITFLITDSEPIDETMLETYLAYDELNAYRKAMTLKKVPPYVQLALDEIFRRKKIFPKSLTLRMKTAKGAVEIQTRNEIGILGAKELSAVAESMGLKKSNPADVGKTGEMTPEIKAVAEMNQLLTAKKFAEFYRNWCHPHLKKQVTEAEFTERLSSENGQLLLTLYSDVLNAFEKNASRASFAAGPDDEPGQYEFIVRPPARTGKLWHLQLELHEGKWKLMDTD